MSWFSEVLSILGSQQAFQFSWASTCETCASECVVVGTCGMVLGSEAGCGVTWQVLWSGRCAILSLEVRDMAILTLHFEKSGRLFSRLNIG